MKELKSIRQLRQSQKTIRILELFSGIGGFREAIQQSGIWDDCCFIAVEINDQANEVYRYLCEQKSNCPDEYFILNRDISSLALSFFIETLCKCHIWTMSPPCQPYTVQGPQRDASDTRAAPLAHICHILSELPQDLLPDIIVLENVPPFATSASYAELSALLTHRNYTTRSLTVSPHQFGWPNRRNRFYVVASRGTLEDIVLDPGLMARSLSSFVDSTLNNPSCVYNLTRQILSRSRSLSLDICQYPRQDVETGGSQKKDSILTQCFTKAYSRYLTGSGSVLQYKGSIPTPDLTTLEHLEGCIRFFAPWEIAGLMGFEIDDFKRIPISDKALYSLLGNSVNCILIRHLLVKALATRVKRLKLSTTEAS